MDKGTVFLISWFGGIAAIVLAVVLIIGIIDIRRELITIKTILFLEGRYDHSGSNDIKLP